MWNSIVAWLTSNQMLAWIGSIIVGIPIIIKAVERFSPKIRKYIHIANAVTKLADDLLTAIEDKNLSTLEIEKLRQDLNDLMIDLDYVPQPTITQESPK